VGRFVIDAHDYSARHARYHARMDWLEQRRHDERRRLLQRVAAYGLPAIGLARWGLYGPAAANARETARLVRPLSPTLAICWQVAADTWQARALPPLRLFEDDEPDA
jgi:hypothetical protein